MARSCGIRIGPRRYELVVLDGSAKKHRITAYRSGEFPLGGDDPAEDAARELRAAAKAHNIPRDAVAAVIDSGHAAFRRLTLPISDRSKIDQVIKFEVEGMLPQWNIDDVVVDYHVLSQDENSCQVLVSAVPKQDLAAIIAICERAGIEPLEIELESSALVNAATVSEICHVDDAQLLVHVSDHSTSVVVMDAGEVREMRVIHIGALTHDVAQHGAAEDLDVEDEEVEETLDFIPEELDPAERARRIDQAIKRIRRELGRTISAARTLHPIDAIYVCGMELPGLIGSDVQDVPIYLLDCFDEDGGQPADGFGQLVVPYGSAVRQLGGGLMRPSLRREELHYSGAFERIEFPLAVACLLLFAFLCTINILQNSERHSLEVVANRWLRTSNFNMVGSLAKGRAGNLNPAPDDIKAYADLFEGSPPAGDSDRTYLESMRYVLGMIQTKILGLQRELGKDSGIDQPQSAFVGTVLVLSVLESNPAWRPSIRSVKGAYQLGQRGREDSVKVTLDLTFFAGSSIEATQHYEAFRQALESKPWFVDFTEKKSESIDGGKGINIQGLPVTVDVSKYFDSLRPGRVAQSSKRD